MRTLALVLATLATVGGLSRPAAAFVPQTITVDGTNDFNVANLLDADGGDTQFTQLDQGNIYLTNDTNFLYFGFDYDRGTWCDINLGISIDKNTAAGGVSDAFGRKIAWNNLARKPDFCLYDVAPTQCSSFNYEVLYKWSGTSWAVEQGASSNGLGIVDGTFTEGKISLATLGLAAGDTLRIEFWVTQEGSTKGPLDASCSDAIQLSTAVPPATNFNVTGAPIEMTCQHVYKILNATDIIPPTVSSATAVGFVTQPDKQIAMTTDRVDVRFSEPVGVGANVPGNYSISNTAATVLSATVDGGDASLVHLILNGTISYSSNFYNVLATGVKDLAANTVVADGTQNRGSFFFKKLRFRGNMSVFLLTHSTPPDSFAVEGSLYPLTFSLRDNAFLKDPDVDSVYVTDVPLSIPQNKGTGVAEVTLAWKFSHNTAGFEPRPDRSFVANNAGGDCDTLFAYWNDDLPSTVTIHPVDVCFQVNANPKGPTPGDVLTVTGDQSPLPNFTIPGVQLKDDGVAPDQTAGDGIYAVYVRFPTGTYKNVQYKYTWNGSFECLGQGNRDVYLNDAAFDTVGGAKGPITLPARKIERCTVTGRPVKVIFRVDADYWFGGPIDSVGVKGSANPLSFAVNMAMQDDGVAPDGAAGDDTFTVAVLFPDSTQFNVEYKYTINASFECVGVSNRMVALDDVVHSAFNPIIPPVGIWDYCQDVQGGVPGQGGDGRDLRPDVTVYLAQNYPNPFGPRTTIEFRTAEPSHARLVVYDVAGRKVATLLNQEVDSGLHIVQWNRRDDVGREMPPGIYFYSVIAGTERQTKRMLLLPD